MGILSIQGPIRLCLIALHENDPTVSKFLSTFRKSLQCRGVIVKESECSTIGEVLQFFRELRQDDDFSCIMIVTHGKKYSGKITYEETSKKPHPIDSVFESPLFLSLIMGDAGQDKLLFLAWCYSGSKEIVDAFLRGQTLSLHAVTSISNSRLYAVTGAKAMALFINLLQNLNKELYEYEDLEHAKNVVDKQYPSAIELWSF